MCVCVCVCVCGLPWGPALRICRGDVHRIAFATSSPTHTRAHTVTGMLPELSEFLRSVFGGWVAVDAPVALVSYDAFGARVHAPGSPVASGVYAWGGGGGGPTGGEALEEWLDGVGDEAVFLKGDDSAAMSSAAAAIEDLIDDWVMRAGAAATDGFDAETGPCLGDGLELALALSTARGGRWNSKILSFVSSMPGGDAGSLPPGRHTRKFVCPRACVF